MRVSDGMTRDIQMALSNESISRAGEIMAATEQGRLAASENDLAIRVLWGFCPRATTPQSHSSRTRAPALASQSGGTDSQTS
jgi:hypothetical protein